MSHEAEIILNQVHVVKLDIVLWTGAKKLRENDLVLGDGSKLPPDELAYLGTKRTCDREVVKIFSTIKKKAESICLETGTRFLGGFANPIVQIPDITKKLDDLAKDFAVARDEFIANYDSYIDDWVKKHPEFAIAIRNAVEPASSVKAKLRFDYVVYRVSMPSSVPNNDPANVIVDQSLVRRTISLSEQLFHEISVEASRVLENSFYDKREYVTARTLNAFRKMRDKLDSLGFLDHRVMPVVNRIDAVLDALPSSPPYNGIAYQTLCNLAHLLSDADKVKRYGEGHLSGSFTDTDEEIEDESQSIVVTSAPSPVDTQSTDELLEYDETIGYEEYMSGFTEEAAPVVINTAAVETLESDLFVPAPVVINPTVSAADEVPVSEIIVPMPVELFELSNDSSWF
ncbi:DUF3150 domain-containing protein [Methylomonas sp. AM2-LC]|uniref:DUF3150 domain-containing protein n=1 Tax=Methylomonas sp. AM2-LC TaxID=3153301 RepID=UPI00326451F1